MKPNPPILDGPLGITVEFRLHRPRDARKAEIWQTKYPDASKLLRSTEDALKQAGTIVDDARLCDVGIFKFLADRDDPWTGALINLWQIDEPT